VVVPVVDLHDDLAKHKAVGDRSNVCASGKPLMFTYWRVTSVGPVKTDELLDAVPSS